MNEKTKKLMATGVIGLTALSAFGAAAYAHNGNFREERQLVMGDEAVEQSIEANDYDSFVSAVDSLDSHFGEKVTQEQFDHIVAQKEIRDALDEAIENQDYEEWVSLMLEKPHGQNVVDAVSKDEFGTFADFHQARVSGDMSAARELATELGFEKRNHREHHAHREKPTS